MRRFSSLALFVLILLLIVGCSGGASSPVFPDIQDETGGNTNISDQNDITLDNGRDAVDSEPETVMYDPDTMPEITDETVHPFQGQQLQGSHALWGLYEISIDRDTDSVEIIPMRAANVHLNAIQFLEPNGQFNLVQLVGGLDWNGDKTQLDITVRLVHPFGGLDQFSGFDVKGILIPRASFDGFDDEGLVTSAEDELQLLNADGYTRWWNPEEFSGNGIFSYTDGALGMKDDVWDFQSTFNGFKYFADSLGPDDNLTDLDIGDRGVFRAGSSNDRHYTLAVPDFPADLIFNYAVDASWEPPAVKPPTVPDDFPIEANQPEPWLITATEMINTIYYDSTIPEQGGELTLNIHVYDWQDAAEAPVGSVERVVVEWPGLFAATEADYVSDEGDYSIWNATIEPVAGSLSSTTDIQYVIWAQSSNGSGYGGILDSGTPLITANRFLATVLPQKVNTPPTITDGVTGNGSPGLATEQYTISWDDPDVDDTITVLWSVEDQGNPYVFDDPGNGDGTIDIDWSLFGFGDYTVQAQVSDGENPEVEATALDVQVGNVPPVVGPITGPDEVTAVDTAAEWTVMANDPDVGQTLSYTWSFVEDGQPDDFTISDDNTLTLDFSAIDPGAYSINVQVTDTFANVDGIAVTVNHNNTMPTVGQVTGKTPVTSADTDEQYTATWSDPDTTQTLSFLWSIVPEGDPEDFSKASNPDGSINIDWSTYPVGSYDLNVQADDGIDQNTGTKLTVVKDNTLPTLGAVNGPLNVSSDNTGASYNADPIADIDPAQTLSALWSIVPNGDPADYILASETDLSLSVDWSTYSDGDYDVNIRVDDGFDQVEGTALTVTKIDNEPPTAGQVDGPTSVTHATLNADYTCPMNDPDSDPLSVLWSVVPSGNAPSYIIAGVEGDPLTVDWSAYADLGDYDVNVQVDDSFNPPVEGTLLTVTIENTAPTAGAIIGDDMVDCTDTVSTYSSTIDDIDTTQSLSILWSVELQGSPANFVIPDGGSGSIDVDWSTYAVGVYEIYVRVDDGVTYTDNGPFAVDRDNLPPTVGSVSGPASVTQVDAEDYTIDPAATDCDPGQTLSFLWSVEPYGSVPDYSISTPGQTLNVDWSGYMIGMWTIGVAVSDGIATSYGTPLDVVVGFAPCTGSAHSYLGTVTPNDYSIAAMSVLPRADITFFEADGDFGLVDITGDAIAQIGPMTLGVFDADAVGTPTVEHKYTLGAPDSVVSLDTDTIGNGRILLITGSAPTQIRVLDPTVIMGDPTLGTVDSGDPMYTWVALDVEADGDLIAIQRRVSGGTTYHLMRLAYDAGGTYTTTSDTMDITAYTGTETDIFDVAVNHLTGHVYVFEAGPSEMGAVHRFQSVDGSGFTYDATYSDMFMTTLDYDNSGIAGFAGYADIDIDHLEGSEERCRVVLYGRLSTLDSQVIRLDGDGNMIDNSAYAEAWPAFAINPDASDAVRNLLMPDEDLCHYWDTPLDW